MFSRRAVVIGVVAAAALSTGFATAGQRLRVIGRDFGTTVDLDVTTAKTHGWIVEPRESATGLRFHRLPAAGGHCGHPGTALAAGEAVGSETADGPTGSVSLSSLVQAVATSGRTVFASLASGTIVEIDARDPSAPRLVRRIPHDPGVRALAASGRRLYLLGAGGLEVLDLSTGSVDVEPAIRGRALSVAGRILRIATDEGDTITVFDDSVAPLVTHVDVSENFYQPDDVTIAIGDTVQWTNTTGDLHNVFSCTPTQLGCDGVASTEKFGSGAATGSFVYDHTFTAAGANPYICQPHAAFMAGRVTVTGGGAGMPPGVPDRAPGAPGGASKLAADGSVLAVSWDTATCSGAADHQILFGYGFQLPPATGGGYELSGSVCSIGGASPYTWNGVPAAFSTSTGFLWWVVVATDGAATEGSWGTDGSGVERQGSGTDGASLECGVSQKSLSNSCGH